VQILNITPNYTTPIDNYMFMNNRSASRKCMKSVCQSQVARHISKVTLKENKDKTVHHQNSHNELFLRYSNILTRLRLTGVICILILSHFLKMTENNVGYFSNFIKKLLLWHGMISRLCRKNASQKKRMNK